MENKKNVLMVAYACEPNESSEPGVGWNFSQKISNFMNITLITRSNNQENIETVPNDAGINYVYYDLPTFITKLKKKIPFGLQLYYILWQVGAYLEAKRLINEEKKYDIFHHLTFGMTKMVPPIFLIKIPSVWGPIGGGDVIPYRFLKGGGVKPFITEFIYRSMHQLSNYSIFSYLTRRSVDAIIFRNSSIMENFPKSGCQNRRTFSETASVLSPKNIEDKVVGDDLRIVCIGRMIQSKGYSYALKGFKNFLEKGGKGKVIFLGKGPEEENLKAYVAANNLSEHVVFRGFVSGAEVEDELQKSHILLHPSFREGGSWAIMEAMSYGLPVVCFDASGPKDMVTDKCGLLIGLESPEQVVEDLGTGLYDLLHNSELFNTLSQNAKKRITNDYSWDIRANEMKEVYKELLNEA
jgi:glycosyltransferase involved in cell wall biosynthesis